MIRAAFFSTLRLNWKEILLTFASSTTSKCPTLPNWRVWTTWMVECSHCLETANIFSPRGTRKRISLYARNRGWLIFLYLFRGQRRLAVPQTGSNVWTGSQAPFFLYPWASASQPFRPPGLLLVGAAVTKPTDQSTSSPDYLPPQPPCISSVTSFCTAARSGHPNIAHISTILYDNDIYR